MKGKSRKSHGGGDFFPTYHEITREFLQTIQLPKSTLIIEPAGGAGDIIKVCREKGYEAVGCDKFPRVDFVDEVDWLDGRSRDKFLMNHRLGIILTNPPYDIYVDFLRACFNTYVREFYFLQPLDYLHSIDRHEMLFGAGYNGVYLTDVWVLVRRPLFNPDFDPAGKVPTGSITFAWFKYTRLPAKPEFWRGYHIDNRYSMGTPSDSPEKYKEVGLFHGW